MKKTGATPATTREILEHQNKRRGRLGMPKHMILPESYRPIPDNKARLADWQQRRKASGREISMEWAMALQGEKQSG